MAGGSDTDLSTVWPPTPTVAAAAGHVPMRPLLAIRQKCLDCSGQQKLEVKLCQVTACALWPFRAGIHPCKKRRSIDGVQRERRPDGTWMPAKAASAKSPSIDGGFLEREPTAARAPSLPERSPS